MNSDPHQVPITVLVDLAMRDWAEMIGFVGNIAPEDTPEAAQANVAQIPPPRVTP